MKYDRNESVLMPEQKKAFQAAIATFNSPEETRLAFQTYIENLASPKLKKKINRSTTPILLRATDVQKTYKQGRQTANVLNGVSLEIHEGEFVAITGASGGGKSTLLQLLGGLDTPTSGEITYGDVSLAKLSDKELSRFRRQTIGFVFQFFYLQPFLTISRNLEVAPMFARKAQKGRSDTIEQLAKKVRLADRLDHLPKELSGGQMQRAAIARALMNRPKIILADEPTGNLDSVNSAAIINLFEMIRKEFGTTIVIVTHDPAIAKRADREIVIKDGLLI